LFRRKIGLSGLAVLFFRRFIVELNEGNVSAALLGMGSTPFVSQEMFESCQEERPKSAFPRIYVAQEVLFQQAGKKLLRQILGFRHFVATPPYEGVERIPIGRTEVLQGGIFTT